MQIAENLFQESLTECFTGRVEIGTHLSATFKKKVFTLIKIKHLGTN